MKIIIPMAGRGTRLRPQTLTTPKPLLPISGKTIVQRLIEELAKSVNENIDEIAFIVGDFGKEVENHLVEIANNLNIKAKIYYQLEALGTAHAIYCARESLNGKVIIAFADTLFKMDFKIDVNEEGIIWVKKVDKPEDFGVVKVSKENYISDFIEKPKEFVSDLAIIGIYYFNDGDRLRNEIDTLIKSKKKVGKEYQLTTVLETLKNDGIKFVPGEVNKWMDCGNKFATIETNSEILKLLSEWERRGSKSKLTNSVIIEPCYIGDGVHLVNSVIGPNVSVENGSTIKNSVLDNSIVLSNSVLANVRASKSMFGNFCVLKNKVSEFNLGDYSRIDDE